APRVGQKTLVQRKLARRRVGQGRELGTQQVAAQELVGDREAAVGFRAQQAVAAGGPEVGHGVARPYLAAQSATPRDPPRRGVTGLRRAAYLAVYVSCTPTMFTLLLYDPFTRPLAAWLPPFWLMLGLFTQMYA